MAALTFFFDPLCPWTWRASRWIREVQRQQDLDVAWRFFSLAEANNFADPIVRAPLRMAALARREGGNEAVATVYSEMGRAIHEAGIDARKPGGIESALDLAAGEGRIDPTLFERAMADHTTLDEVLADHREATDRYRAYGVPWLVREGQEIGFNGPILTQVPEGTTATALWEHLSFLIAQPYFYELKRER